MKKKVIGRAQLIIGIVVLILGIAGLIYSVMLYKKVDSLVDPQTGQIGDSIYYNPGLGTDAISMYVTLEFILISTSVILIFLSLLFITQGLGKLANE